MPEIDRGFARVRELEPALASTPALAVRTPVPSALLSPKHRLPALRFTPPEKLLELPVDEELQMGMTNGLALDGKIPVSIFPRWNFLLLAVNQIVNHLDKIELMSNGGYRPKVIIRTGIGSERPLHPQHQHVGDYTEAFRLMCPNIEVIRLEDPEEIFPAYQRALLREDGKSTLIVEYGDYYNEK